MSSVRVLVGTRKGAFILTADGKRQKWDVSGPLFSGWEIYHMKGSPVDPKRIYASQTSGWFGQVMQRSDDGGKTWTLPGTPSGVVVGSPAGVPGWCQDLPPSSERWMICPNQPLDCDTKIRFGSTGDPFMW